MKPRNQGLAGDNLQEVLDAAANASEKGTQQFLTPPDIAAALAAPLPPKYRGTIVDFQCGAGALLAGAANATTENLLGIDIDPRAKIKLEKNLQEAPPIDLSVLLQNETRTPQRPALRRSVIHGDLTTLYPLLAEIGWRCDLVTLNPPFSLKWHRSRLALLAESRAELVSSRFKDGRGSHIESTLATLLMAIDRLSDRGEGYMICSETTARKIFGDPEDSNATDSYMRHHAWLWLKVPNFFANVGRTQKLRPDAAPFSLAVVYFTRELQSEMRHLTAAAGTAEAIVASLAIAVKERDIWREGITIASHYYGNRETPSLFRAVKEEHERAQDTESPHRFNLWLDGRGLIRRHLTTFQNLSARIPKQDVKDLDAIEHQSPMALVVQRATRLTLLRAVRGNIWRVDPALVKAVDEALRDYDAIRAPFYPLNEIQRLGYLDESDSILCKKNLTLDSGITFAAGLRYPLGSRTVPVEREVMRANLNGKLEKFEITGMELLIEITAETGVWGFTHDPANSDVTGKSGTRPVAGVHDLPALVDHFEIPAVPDIAAMRPEEYARNLKTLDRIEAMLAGDSEKQPPTSSGDALHDAVPVGSTQDKRVVYERAGEYFTYSAFHNITCPLSDRERSEMVKDPDPRNDDTVFRFKQYQREDMARAAMHDGAIKGWDPGLGKTVAAFTWPMLKGARHVLIVAPGGLHEQIIKEGREKFKVAVRPLMSQADFYNDELLQSLVRNQSAGALPSSQPLNPSTSQPSMPLFWLTTYQALGLNGADEWLPKTDIHGHYIPNERRDRSRFAHPAFQEALQRNVREITETVTTERGASPEVLEKIKALNRLASCPAAYQGEIENALRFMALLREKYFRQDLPDSLDLSGKNNPENPVNPVQFFSGIGEERNGIRCIYSPTLARLCGTPLAGGEPDATACCFDCVVADEAVRVKSTESFISQGIRQLNPRFRLLLTGTPIKNLLIDLFWLAHWVCGGHDQATARWPYEDADEARERFADEHMLQERNVTREEESKERTGKRTRYVKRTAQICNIHRLWKLLGPVIIRRRKDDCGEDLVPKTIIPIRVRPGTAQQKVYQRYLLHKPIMAKATRAPRTLSEHMQAALHPGAAIGMQLQLLRQAALCPDSPKLKEAILKPEADEFPARSWTDLNPKSVSILSLTADLLVKGECVAIISPFQDFNTSIVKRLREAGVSVALADGTVNPLKRGKTAAGFKTGIYSVLVGGTESMSEGHSFEHCAHLIIPSLTWAMDKNAQAIERVHRLNSTRPVTIYTMVTENTIDVRLESLFSEKKDSSQLALDGRLFAERTEEINLAQLLHDAIADFDPNAITLDEQSMETQWETVLRDRLRHAETTFRDPSTPPMPANKDGVRRGDRKIILLPDQSRAAPQLEWKTDFFTEPSKQYALAL